MFKVIDKRESKVKITKAGQWVMGGGLPDDIIVEENIIHTVYNIKYKNGYPYFTLYKNGRWITESAKYYVPVGVNYE